MLQVFVFNVPKKNFKSNISRSFLKVLKYYFMKFHEKRKKANDVTLLDSC